MTRRSERAGLRPHQLATLESLARGDVLDFDHVIRGPEPAYRRPVPSPMAGRQAHRVRIDRLRQDALSEVQQSAPEPIVKARRR